MLTPYPKSTQESSFDTWYDVWHHIIDTKLFYILNGACNEFTIGNYCELNIGMDGNSNFTLCDSKYSCTSVNVWAKAESSKTAWVKVGQSSCPVNSLYTC